MFTNDDEFGEQSDEQPSTAKQEQPAKQMEPATQELPKAAPEKVDFKPMMKIPSVKEKKLVTATLDEQKKRNIIDKPIVDIEDCFSDDSSNADSKKIEEQKSSSLAVKSRFGKLMSITSESTQEFKD